MLYSVIIVYLFIWYDIRVKEYIFCYFKEEKKNFVYVKYVIFYWFVWKNIIILISYCKIKNIIKRKCIIFVVGNVCNMVFIELFFC